MKEVSCIIINSVVNVGPQYKLRVTLWHTVLHCVTLVHCVTLCYTVLHCVFKTNKHVSSKHTATC